MNTVNTLKIYTEIVCGASVPDEAVYQFIKAAVENTSTYVDAHVACQEINGETALPVLRAASSRRGTLLSRSRSDPVSKLYPRSRGIKPQLRPTGVRECL